MLAYSQVPSLVSSFLKGGLCDTVSPPLSSFPLDCLPKRAGLPASERSWVMCARLCDSQRSGHARPPLPESSQMEQLEDTGPTVRVTACGVL